MSIMKFPRLCGDSLFIIFMGGALMTIFGIAIVGIRAANLHHADAVAEYSPQEELLTNAGNDLIYLLEMVIVVSVLCWRVFQSCVELEEMHERIQMHERLLDATYRKTFQELIDGYELMMKGEKVKVDMNIHIHIHMAEPRPCSYTQEMEWDHVCETSVPKKTEIIGKGIRRKKIPNNRRSNHTPMPVELRGITLRQLRAINANIVARCETEGWVSTFDGKPLTPETVTLYDVNKYIVLPFTEESQASFVETLPSTTGTQPPRWFVSHWWGELFVHTLACLEQFVEDFSVNFDNSDDVRGGGMTEDTPIWICIFANNQWNLDEAISIDTKDSTFTLGLMGTCENRVISILDAGGNVFARIGYDFELYLTLTAQMKGSGGLWAVYTAHKHTYKHLSYSNPEDRDAVGIISGGAPMDGGSAESTSRRESYFPIDLIRKSRTIQIESAKASQESDRKHILNSIVKNANLEAVPPTTHPNYDAVNDAIKGAFAASMPALKAAAIAGGDEWTETLDCLSKSIMTDTFELDFSKFVPRLSSSQARELVSHVPSTCDGLNIIWANGGGGEGGEDGEGAIEGMMEWIGKANTIKQLGCYACKMGNVEGGQDAGSRLADALKASNHVSSIEELGISGTDLVVSGNVLEWESSLKKMTSLKKLWLGGVDDYISDEEKIILRNATHASDIYGI